jgi:hypothetical protein
MAVIIAGVSPTEQKLFDEKDQEIAGQDGNADKLAILDVHGFRKQLEEYSSKEDPGTERNEEM